jgi:malate dehydrogenase
MARSLSVRGQALSEKAADDVRVVVVGNPCNTNALIAMKNAPGIPNERFTAMTRLDHNRAVGLLAKRGNTTANAIQDIAVWGNHSNTMYPDVTRANIGGAPVDGTFDRAWLRGEFLTTVANRGKAIIEARGASSAASAASAAVDHMHDWEFGTNGRITSMAIPSKGWYGVPKGPDLLVPGDRRERRVHRGRGLERGRVLPEEDRRERRGPRRRAQGRRGDARLKLRRARRGRP